MRQKGFATLEVILMVVVIGILASIAVPRFSKMTAAANTARIQADLSTIDAAIAVYYLEKGSAPGSVEALADYFQGQTAPTPPTGGYYLKGSLADNELTTSSKYEITGNGSDARAYLLETNNTADKFYVTDKGNSSSTGGGTTTTGGGSATPPGE